MSLLPATFGSLGTAVRDALATLDRLTFTAGLWSRRVEMWTDDPETQAKIGNRLGWLTAMETIAPQIPRLGPLAVDVRELGITDVVLLGMGGSSLAPEVIRQVIGPRPGSPRFRMLDSVDPDAVDRALGTPSTTLFLLASKSGGTIEPNAMAAEAARRLQALGITPGSRFVAITDQGTALHQRAQTEGFRDIFVNPSDIGGRYSALSLFGLVPAALMGLDVEALLGPARAMATACRSERADNPGVTLGAFMGAGALAGRDKLTLLLPPALASFGLWVEQLVAESTGKRGLGVVPITGEAPDAELGSDRIAVIVRMQDGEPPAELVARVKARQVPYLEITLDGPMALGAEFFRWEVATAAAGRLLGVNPFDEPNVQTAKDATNSILQEFGATGALPVPRIELEHHGIRCTLSTAARARQADPQRFLECVRDHDYISVMAFMPSDDPALAAALNSLRDTLGRVSRRPTMLGYGPRYLHSTGQLHKGGADNAVFIVLASPSDVDFQVPGAAYSFGTLTQAQALGDFASLQRAQRRALFVVLPSRGPDALTTLERLLTGRSA